MAIPEIPLWAETDLTTSGAVEGFGSITYDNKAEPPEEIKSYGYLLGVPVTFQHLNYQFSQISACLQYLLTPETQVEVDSGTTRTLTLADKSKYLRFTNADPVSYTINQGVVPIGTRLEIRQAAAGVITLTAGSGVTFNLPTGTTVAKTSGVGTDIWAIKISEGVGIESWDIGGKVGV